MNTQNKKLEFYGGEWVSFLPLVIFIGLIIVTTFVFSSISDGALWVPPFMALLIPFFFAKDKRHYGEVIINGMASRDAVVPVVCWIFAGVLAWILRGSNLAQGLAGFAAGLGVSQTMFLIVTFISAGLFATATGTGFGTIAAGMGVLYPAGVALGIHPGLLAGAIVSGGAFGDNIAPISDTTICSALTQNVDIPGVVKSRMKYALLAAGISIVLLIVLGQRMNTPVNQLTVIEYNPLTLIMLVPVAVTVWVAIKTGDIVIATTIGIVISSVTAIVFGLIDFVQIDAANPSNAALLAVYGEGLGRTVDGLIFTGINSMLQVSVLALLLFGSISIMRAGGGDRKMLDALGHIARGVTSTEFTLSGMILALTSIMGLNAPAILAVGTSFGKPLAIKHGISPYRTANLIDAQSCTLVYTLPWTPAIIFTIGFTRDSAAPLAALDVTPFVIYCYALLAIMFLSVVFKIGRMDNMTKESFEEWKLKQAVKF